MVGVLVRLRLVLSQLGGSVGAVLTAHCEVRLRKFQLGSLVSCYVRLLSRVEITVGVVLLGLVPVDPLVGRNLVAHD